MSIFRKEETKRPALVAAAAKVDINDKAEVKRAAARKEEWQNDAWQMYDDIGEVKYGVNFLSNSCARLRLFAGEKPDDPKDKPSATENSEAIEVLDRLRSPMGGHAQILQPLAQNLSVPGECHLIGLEERDNEGESWGIYSTDEIVTENEKLHVINENDKKILLGDDDFVLRIWTRHARKRSKADSSLHGVLSSCREIVLVEKAIAAIAASRIANAGVFLLPTELSFGSDNPERDDGVGDESDSTFLAALTTAMVTPIRDSGSASAIVPIVLEGAGESLDKVRHLTFERPFDPELDKRMERAQRRLAQGLNVPPEVILGLADVNHWTAWQIDDSTFKAHVEPLAVVICDALTVGYLHPMLKNAGVTDPEKYVVWFDPSDLVINPNREQSANDGHDRFTISDESWRQTHGFTDDDAPDDEEIQRRILQKSAGRPALGDRPVAPGPPEQEEPESEPPAEAAVTAAAQPKRGQSLGRKLTEIDRNLRTMLLAAADAAMVRALEKAGARLKSKAQKDKSMTAAVSGVPLGRIAETLGPGMVAALGMDESQLLDEAFDSVQPKFAAWVARAQDEARNLIPAMSAAEHQAVKAQQLRDLDDAWLWLSDSLTSLAKERLYNPAPSAPLTGEVIGNITVPYGLVREAVARAGGADGIEKVGAGVFLSNGEPVGGVADGQVVRNLLQAKGGAIEGWEWIYGAFPRERPFEPHAALDGLVFQSFTDQELANTEGWPGEYLLPGDHDGCFIAGTEVLAPGLKASTERTYSGDVVEIITASGKEITVTPNHPILTSDGWVPAGLLNEGDHVVSSSVGERIASLVDPHHAQDPALIEDVTRTLGGAGPVLTARMETTPEHFHGDGSGSDIHVVRSNRLLHQRLEASLAEHLRHGPVERRDVTLAKLARDRSSLVGVSGIRNASLGIMSRSNDLHSTFRRPLTVDEQEGLAHPARFDAFTEKPFADGVSVNPVGVRQSLLRLSREITGGNLGIRKRSLDVANLDAASVKVAAKRLGINPRRLGGVADSFARLVKLDAVVHLRRVRKSAIQVFNLHTETNWYLAGGIVAHNCVCDVSPAWVIPEETEESVPALAAAGGKR